MIFEDREDAGRRLAAELEHLRGENPVVVGLPRGGVPVAHQVAQALGAPLDVVIVRKLGVPTHRELGFGAIGEGGVRVVRDDIVRLSHAQRADLDEVQRHEEAELVRRARQFRGDRPRIPFEGRTVIIVDDGIATGSTAAAACKVARAAGAARVVLAVPVAPPEAVENLRPETDELVCLSSPRMFSAVGEWYRGFAQTPDSEVVSLLARSHAGRAGTAARAEDTEVVVEAGDVRLPGHLSIPEGCPGIVVFAHGSGSSRHSPRNRAVARSLGESGLGTLLFDLLTREEELDRVNVFDVETLAARLAHATRLLAPRGLPVGCFGASTGAAAALRAAAEPDTLIEAVVSRGGRPDLAGQRLADVRAPTLLIVGGRDETVLDLNRRAKEQLRCESRLEVVPGATHLFEEPGTLDAVAVLARDWFVRHLAPGR
ncbi:phosphoribosyltransferase family protein [Streptomyces meridianus]|uniref:Dienelactone hydrolase family protein n=1 Tax=Streptomyces meridianus TaxID=2938945 RepID=A0ABT0XCS3_9ACTN|nr:phosphoribosyltransferase family protein [Streptomyces meridianus]MCM2580327.1 dienelactone hydrolase family protein [Streptomyces meridianus]